MKIIHLRHFSNKVLKLIQITLRTVITLAESTEGEIVSSMLVQTLKLEVQLWQLYN